VSENAHGVKNPQGQPERGEDGRLLPGNTANPGGMSKEAKAFRELLKGLKPQTVRVARKALDRAENTSALEAIINDGEASPEARLEAEGQLNARMKIGAQMIAEIWKYSVPKPLQKHKLSGQLSNPLGDVSTEDIQALIRAAKGEGK
jgi:hypothetical protein